MLGTAGLGHIRSAEWSPLLKGRTIPPKLFTACTVWVFWEPDGGGVAGKRGHLRTAHLQKMLHELQSESLAVGLQIKHAESAIFSIGSEILEQVEKYNCIGKVVIAGPNHKKEIRRRLGLGWGARTQSQILHSEK